MAEPRKKGLKVGENEAQLLRLPKVSLPAYGYLSDLGTSDVVKFDQDRVTYKLQQTLISYFSDPSTIEGRTPAETYWLTVLKSRQTGSSNTCALCAYAMVSYTPAFSVAIAADKKSRADEVFSRINLAYNKWDPAIRTERESTNETRSLTTSIGSKIVVLSADTPDMGVGRSVDLFIATEPPLWPDAESQLSALSPSMMNRMSSKMVWESTPQPLDSPSGRWWMDHWMTSVAGQGRFVAAFFPYWDSKANARPWPKGQAPTNDEIRLLERYGGTDRWGHPGLTLDNLEFRRWTMQTDTSIKRNPELFDVWYPKDDQTCWIDQGTGVIPAHAIDHQLARKLYEEKDDYNEFPETWNGTGKPVYEVNPNAVYVMGVDPAGYGRDHQAFQVLEVWDDEWIQVASFGAVMDPNEFVKLCIEKALHFNKAKLVFERTGVGQGHAMLARQLEYPNLYYDEARKPGLHKGNQEEWLEKLVDALMGPLTLRGKQTAMWTKGYRHDKMTEKSQRAELLRPSGVNAGPGRRTRGHWDKVSALMVACVVAPKMPRRYKPVQEPENVIPFNELSWKQHQEYQAYLARLNQPKRKLSYRRRRG